MDDDNVTQFPSPGADMVAKLAVGLVLLTMAVLVSLAVLSFFGQEPLDNQSADVIKKVADAAAGGGAE